MTLLELADGGQPLLPTGDGGLALTTTACRSPPSPRPRPRRSAPPAVPRRGLLPRRRQDEQGRLLHREPAVRRPEPPPQPLPQRLAADHHRARERRRGAGRGVQPANQPSSNSTTVRRWSNSSTTVRTNTAAVRPGRERAQYRYPGPKPRTRRSRSSCSPTPSSAARSMSEPTAARVEARPPVVDGRLLDGQFDECDLTMASWSSSSGR